MLTAALPGGCFGSARVGHAPTRSRFRTHGKRSSTTHRPHPQPTHTPRNPAASATSPTSPPTAVTWLADRGAPRSSRRAPTKGCRPRLTLTPSPAATEWLPRTFQRPAHVAVERHARGAQTNARQPPPRPGGARCLARVAPAATTRRSPPGQSIRGKWWRHRPRGSRHQFLLIHRPTPPTARRGPASPSAVAFLLPTAVGPRSRRGTSPRLRVFARALALRVHTQHGIRPRGHAAPDPSAQSRSRIRPCNQQHGTRPCGPAAAARGRSLLLTRTISVHACTLKR